MGELVKFQANALSRAVTTVYKQYDNTESKEHCSTAVNSMSAHANDGGVDKSAVNNSGSTAVANKDYGAITHRAIAAAFSFRFGRVGKGLFYLHQIIDAVVQLPYRLIGNSHSNPKIADNQSNSVNSKANRDSGLSSAQLFRYDEIGGAMAALSRIALSNEVLTHVSILDSNLAKIDYESNFNEGFNKFKTKPANHSNNVLLKVNGDKVWGKLLYTDPDTNSAAYKTEDGKKIIVASATVCAKNKESGSATKGVLIYDKDDKHKSMSRDDFKDIFTGLQKELLDEMRKKVRGARYDESQSIVSPLSTHGFDLVTEPTESVTSPQIDGGYSEQSQHTQESAETESSPTPLSQDLVADSAKRFDNPLLSRNVRENKYFYSEWNDTGTEKVEVLQRGAYALKTVKVDISGGKGAFNYGVYKKVADVSFTDANQTQRVSPSAGPITVRKIEPVTVSIEQYSRICRDLRVKLRAVGKEGQFVVPTPSTQGGWRVAVKSGIPTVNDFEGKDFIWSMGDKKLYIIKNGTPQVLNHTDISNAIKMWEKKKYTLNLEMLFQEITKLFDNNTADHAHLESGFKDILDGNLDEYTLTSGEMVKPKIPAECIKVMMPYVEGKPLGESYTQSQYYKVVERVNTLYEMGYPVARLDGKPDNCLLGPDGELVLLDLFLLKKELELNDLPGNPAEFSGLDIKKYKLMRAECAKQGISFNVVNQLQIVASPANHLLGGKLLGMLLRSKNFNEDSLRVILGTLPRKKCKNRDEYIKLATSILQRLKDKNLVQLESINKRISLISNELIKLPTDSVYYADELAKKELYEQKRQVMVNKIDQLSTRIDILPKLLMFLPKGFTGFSELDNRKNTVNSIIEAVYDGVANRSAPDVMIICENILNKLLPQVLPQPFNNRNEYINFILNWIDSSNLYDMSNFYYSTFIAPYIKLPSYNDSQFSTELNNELSAGVTQVLNNRVVSVLALFECEELRGKLATIIKDKKEDEFKQLLQAKLKPHDFPQGFNSDELQDGYISFISNLVFGKNIADIIEFSNKHLTTYRDLPFYTNSKFKEQLNGKGLSKEKLLQINNLISKTLYNIKALPDAVGAGKEGMERKPLETACIMKIKDEYYPEWAKTDKERQEFIKFLKNWAFGENVDEIIAYWNSIPLLTS